MKILRRRSYSSAGGRRSVLLAVALSATFLFGYLDMNVVSASGTAPVADTPSTPEPDPAPGCRAPEIRYIKPKAVEPTTEASYVDFETTQIYLPEDFTTSDGDSIEHINIDLSSSHTDSAINPYQIDMDGGGGGVGNAAALHSGEAEEENGTEDPLARRQRLRMERKMGKKRRAGGRRRRLENENGQSRGTGSGRGSRYKRHAIHKDDSPAAEQDKWSGAKLAAEGEVYYVHLDDLLNSKSLNKELRQKLHKMKQKHLKERSNKCSSTGGSSGDKKNTDSSCKTKPNYKNGNKNKQHQQQPVAVAGDVVVDGNEPIPKQAPNHSSDNGPPKRHHRTKRSSLRGAANDGLGGKHNQDEEEVLTQRRQHRENNNDIETTNIDNSKDGYLDDGKSSSSQLSAQKNSKGNTTSTLQLGAGLRHDNGSTADDDGSEAGTADNLQRVKRKSGKTTGALSRPKGGGDSGSKTTSRKDKGAFEEEGGYSPVHPDEEESEEEEVEEADSDEQVHFTEVSEIRFPGEIGPLGDRRLCKIRCIKGKWVGPLCATNEEDEHGHIKFQPLYKSCHVNRIPPHLLLSYRNISVNNIGWDLPHGHSLQARCKDLGLYKLLGESRVLCSNGLWAPRMPSCVPTTLLTNFSDDSAPSIRIKIGSGSGAFEPSGVLAVLPSSTIHMDCMYPRARGTPEWTWTSWYMQYNTGWSTVHEEKSTKYRLTIKDIQNSDSGTFTCTSPRGLTNSISIIVATSTCPQLTEPAAPLSLRLEGNKLGQRALYRCPQGYRVDGTVNSTCLASGNWSTPPPTCQAVQCPRLILEDSHLSLVELNTSAWGRAVFKCQWGFKLNGPPGLECEPSGVWSGPVPRCRAIQCPAPLVPLNGRIGGTSGSSSHRRYAVGALVTFSCNEGHLLVGEASIVCTETGFWSHPPPFCKSQCPYPGDPPNGLIAPLKFNYDSGDFLSVQCRPGFVEYSPAGPPERPKCLPDGNWSGPVPQCRSYEDV